MIYTSLFISRYPGWNNPVARSIAKETSFYKYLPVDFSTLELLYLIPWETKFSVTSVTAQGWRAPLVMPLRPVLQNPELRRPLCRQCLQKRRPKHLIQPICAHGLLPGLNSVTLGSKLDAECDALLPQIPFSNFGMSYLDKATSLLPPFPSAYRIPHRLSAQQVRRIAEIICMSLGGLFLFLFLTGNVSRPSSHRVDHVPGAWPGWSGISNIFVFGDSFSDVGFDVFKLQPNPANPFGNPEWQLEVRSGTTWMHFLALTYNVTTLRIWDLAIGGSTIDPDIVVPYLGLTSASLKHQLAETFLPIYGPRPDFARWMPVDTLFILWFGINDIVVPSTQMDYPPIPKIQKSYALMLEQLYNLGARNFLLLNVPPVHKAHQKADYATFEGSAILDWNKELVGMRDGFAHAHRDAFVFLFDAHTLWTRALARPKRFEETRALKVLSEPCDGYSAGGVASEDFVDPVCDAPIAEYFWLNALHATFAVHNATARYVVRDCFGRDGPKGYCS